MIDKFKTFLDSFKDELDLSDGYSIGSNQLDGYVEITFGRKQVGKLKHNLRINFMPIGFEMDGEKQYQSTYMPQADGYDGYETPWTKIQTLQVDVFAKTYQQVDWLHDQVVCALSNLYKGSGGDFVLFPSPGTWTRDPAILATGEQITFDVNVAMPVVSNPFGLTQIESIGIEVEIVEVED